MVTLLGPIGMILIGALFILLATKAHKWEDKYPSMVFIMLVIKGELKKENYEGTGMLMPLIMGVVFLGLGFVLLAVYFLG